MTKTELIDVIAADASVTKKAVSEFLNLFIAQVQTTDKITIPGFGTFKHVVKPAHKARNPITGKPVQVAKKTVLKFKASK